MLKKKIAANKRNDGWSMQIGDTLRLIREGKGVSQEELALTVGISPEAIGHYEDNSWRPGTPILVRLAEALGTTIPELTGGCNLLAVECGHLLIVRHIGSTQIEVVGTVNEEDIPRIVRKEEE